MGNLINIKGLVLDIEKAMKRTKLDIKDDWFQDPLKYDDILNIENILNKINNKLIKNALGENIGYKAGIALHIDIPKPGFTSRYTTEIDIIDRVFCQALIDFIAEDLDALHSNRIYSHRLNKERRDEKYFFRYPVEEWKKFINDTELELGADNNVLLLTDLTNFYENIGVSDLKDVLEFYKPAGEKEIQYKDCIELIKTIHSKWCERSTERGIPQNRDTSSFLANIFLHPVDDAMQKSGYNYFRYMDDIRVVCKNKYEARKALKILIQELRKKGLNVNSKKTQILDYDNVEDRKKIEDSFSHSDKKIEQIEAFLKSRNQRDIQIAVPMLRNKILNLIENDNTLEREFRYCVNRLERISRNEKLADKIDFNPITERILNELIDQPWATDTFARYLGSVKLDVSDKTIIKDLLLDKNKNIYEWQSFYLWLLLTRHHFHDPLLINTARLNIEQKVCEPTTAVSCLYLGVNGDVNDKIFIAEHFLYFNDHLTQRFALIAIKDLNYQSVIKPHVQDYIKEYYSGSYKNLSEKYKNQFLHPIESLKEEDIYTELPDDIS